MAAKLRGGPYRCAIGQCPDDATALIQERGPATCSRHVEAGRLSVAVGRLREWHWRLVARRREESVARTWFGNASAEMDRLGLGGG